MKSFLTTLVLVALAAASAPVHAQQPPLRITGEGRSAVEEGMLNYFHLTPTVLGAQNRAMGGTGIAMAGRGDQFSLNPAGIMGVERWELSSEGLLISGSASVSSFPALLPIGSDALDVSNYRVTPGGQFRYGNLTLAIPMVFLGKRGVFAGSYQRHRLDALRDESRFEASGTLTQGADATVGIGNRPNGGYDAITLALAREVTGWLDIGANLNLHSGDLTNDGNSGVAVFGQPQSTGGVVYDQTFKSTSVDIGARAEFGALSVGGTYAFAHDINYDAGHAITSSLASPGEQQVILDQTIRPHDLSVPSRLGLGGSYEFSRFTVSADYWRQNWSTAKITRQELTSQWLWLDPSDSSTFAAVLVPGQGMESFNAQMNDASSIRLGLQFMIHESSRVKAPVWVGYRREDTTLPNIEIPPGLSSYTELIYELWRYTTQGVAPPYEGRVEEVETAVSALTEHSQFVYHSGGKTASFFTFGGGITYDNVTLETSVELRSFDLDRFFFQPFDPLTFPLASKTKESHSTTTISVGARIMF